MIPSLELSIINLRHYGLGYEAKEVRLGAATFGRLNGSHVLVAVPISDRPYDASTIIQYSGHSGYTPPGIS